MGHDAKAAFWIAEKPSKLRAMKNKRVRKYAECWKHFKAGVRAKVEHPFRVVKRQFGCTKVRCRGLVKNAARARTLFALSNLWMARRVCCSRRVKSAWRMGKPVENRLKWRNIDQIEVRRAPRR